MNDMRSALVTAGIDPTAIHSELFGSLPAIQPGVVDAPPKRPHPPSVAGTGPQMTFARSGLTVKWSAHYGSILELAEACDVPARYSCRSGVCHTCETEILAGATTYVQAPLEEPRKGTTLICCAVPQEDLVVDL
jgi:ferredoxin